MNIDYKNLKIDLLELLDESWNQVANSCPNNPEEMTVEQIHAYTVAMCVITKMEEQITQYLKTGEKKSFLSISISLEIYFNRPDTRAQRPWYHNHKKL